MHENNSLMMILIVIIGSNQFYFNISLSEKFLKTMNESFDYQVVSQTYFKVEYITYIFEDMIYHIHFEKIQQQQYYFVLLTRDRFLLLDSFVL